MTAWVRSPGEAVHHTRVARRRRPRGLEARYPTPRLSQPPPAPRVSPALLRGGPITRVQQVQSPDITSIRLHGGWISLGAVMDGCRRSVLAWAVSITMDVGWGLDAWADALALARPDSCTTDHGAQFPSIACTGRLAAAGRHRSMDGRGRALDNVFVERLWRTVNYAEVSWKDDKTPREAMQGCETFFVRDHERRQQQSLDDRTPAAVYFNLYVWQSL